MRVQIAHGTLDRMVHDQEQTGWSRLFDSRNGRILLENLTAYLFLAPSLLLVFLFGLFPVAFAFFVSLHRWRRLPENYEGLNSFYQGLGNLAFVLFFWLALAALAYAGWTLWRTLQQRRSNLILMIPAILNAAAILAAVNWVFTLIPVILNIPARLRGQPLGSGLFVDELIRSFSFGQPIAAANTMALLLLAAVITSLIGLSIVRHLDGLQHLTVMTVAALSAATGLLLLRLTMAEVQSAIDTASGSPPIWSQIVLISMGVLLMAAAYALWQHAIRRHNDRRFALQSLAAIFLLIGGYVLMVQLPLALADADRRVLQSLNVTVMYSAFSIPVQLIFGLALAVLLFQKIRYRSFFRVMFFLPYVMPAVATAAIFSIVFSNRPNAPANQILSVFGIETQNWLMEPEGVLRLIFGPGIPDWLAGPGLALTAILIFNIWTYAGFAAVIFLAGLGNIPKELYEASRIDGASGWQSFRYVTIPLLSPTLFFQVLIATIGTFQAFTQIWLMRQPGAYDAVDTISIYIFQNVRSAHPDYAYGSALAFVLFFVILALTLFQNRMLGRRVFYG